MEKVSIRGRVAAAIAVEQTLNKEALLSADWRDSITLYEAQIKEALIKYHGISDGLAVYILENSMRWNDEYFIYVATGFPHVSRGVYSLAAVGELCIARETLRIHHGLNTAKTSVRAVINHNCDLYISENGDGFLNCDYDYIGLNLECFDVDTWKEEYTLED